jgi:hypothetical protein
VQDLPVDWVHPGRTDADANLARPWAEILDLDHLEHLDAAVLGELHRSGHVEPLLLG